MSKILIELSEDNTENTIDLKEHEDKFIIRIVNYKVSYDGAAKEIEVVTKNNSSLKRCDENEFTTAYEAKYYSMNKNRFQFCPNDKELVMEGLRDSAIFRKSHSYIRYELQRCNDEVRNSLGIEKECASEEEINNFIERKKVSFRVIQDKIDFTNYTKELTTR